MRVVIAGGELLAVTRFEGYITPATAHAARSKLLEALARGAFSGSCSNKLYCIELCNCANDALALTVLTPHCIQLLHRTMLPCLASPAIAGCYRCCGL